MSFEDVKAWFAGSRVVRNSVLLMSITAVVLVLIVLIVLLVTQTSAKDGFGAFYVPLGTPQGETPLQRHMGSDPYGTQLAKYSMMDHSGAPTPLSDRYSYDPLQGVGAVSGTNPSTTKPSQFAPPSAVGLNDDALAGSIGVDGVA